MSIFLDASISLNDLPEFYKKLEELPDQLSSIKISDGERDPRYPISLVELISKKDLPVNPMGGYFLHSNKACYCIRLIDNEAVLFIACADDDTAKKLINVLASMNVIYAYACQSEEREHQNRISAHKNYGREEAWVGRNFTLRLPGVYWLNLIPSSLLASLGIEFEQLNSISISSEKIGDTNYLVQLYSSSTDWVNEKTELMSGESVRRVCFLRTKQNSP